MPDRNVICPACGRAFEVGQAVKKVTCNFCGTVFENEGVAIPAADFNVITNLLTPQVTFRPGLMGEFNRTNYASLFDAYYAELSKSLSAFDDFYNDGKAEKKELMRQYADTFALQVKKNAGVNNFNDIKEPLLGNVIYLYVAFAVPSILRFGRDYSDSLADAVLEAWNREHKKRKLGKSSFEEINDSFKLKLCFITTAVCQSLNRPDNCYELNSFRSFRDGYLASQPEGEAQIAEYYLIAPMIVAAIDKSPDRGKAYHRIWNTYLSKCLGLIEQNRNSECRDCYTAMVEDLSSEWL